MMTLGRGFSRRTNLGQGYGFRGYSPAWPYVGRGRGGLPRCWAYSGAYPFVEGGYPAQGGFGAWRRPLNDSPLPSEQELSFWKNQAVMLRQHLEQIDVRIKELERISQPS